MKSTGIVRKVDDLGRLVIPMEIRKSMNIETRDPIEIFVEEERIILKKYQPSCIFCENASDLLQFKGKLICPECLEKLKKEG